jgi:hypothetical protein
MRAQQEYLSIGSEAAGFFRPAVVHFAAEVMTIAESFAATLWEELNDKTKNELLDKSIAALGQLMNNPKSAEKIRVHLNHEFARKAKEYD